MKPHQFLAGFMDHTPDTLLPVLLVIGLLALIAVLCLGWMLNNWRKAPRWAAWRAAFRHMGWMPLAALLVVGGLSATVTYAEDDPFLRGGVVAVLVPLLMALQAAAAFSPDEEPALEMTLAAPRPIAWLIVERLAAIGFTYSLIALVGSGIILLRQPGLFSSTASIPVLLLAWASPAIFLMGVGVYVTLRSRMVAFGVVMVIVVWVIFGLFGRFLLPGLPVPPPLSWIQPYLWPMHIFLTPQDLPAPSYAMNRLFLSSAGIVLLLAAVRSVSNTEGVLLSFTARSRKSSPDAPNPPAAGRTRQVFNPVPVRPNAIAQIAGIAMMEFRMLWRQRVMKVFAVAQIALFLFLVLVNMSNDVGDASAFINKLSPQQAGIIYGELLVSMMASFTLAMVLWVYPLLVANQVPYDRRSGMTEMLQALPLSDSAYLAGKVLGATLAGASTVALNAVIYSLVWFIKEGPFYPVPLVSMLALALLLLLVVTAQGVLLGATQNNAKRALAIVLVVMLVPEFLQAIPLVKQVLPGSTDFFNLPLQSSMQAMTIVPPIRRNFNPLEGRLFTLYSGLVLKTFVITCFVWAWRRWKMILGGKLL